jgi:ferrous iron transport protein A
MTDTIRLDSLKPGDSCRLQDIRATGATAQRFMDLGLIPGVVITVVRNAPLVDPVELLVKNNYISIRHSEAGKIEVIPLCRR